MKKLFTLLFIVLSALSLFACDGLTPGGTDDDGSGDGDGDGGDPVFEKLENFVLPEDPKFSPNVSAHDPSIYHDGTKYYTFGSHFAVTSSTDLIHWVQESRDSQPAFLYGTSNWKTVLSDAFAHVGNGASSTWAPAVTKFGDKFYMYYSLSTFGSAVSYIGRVEADTITGPYSNSKLIVKSDGRGGANAIDPEVFWDNDGKLWMVYGSFFAGIYIKELYNEGDNIGLPKEDGYGKGIWAGGTGPEGPYIFYNPDTKFYYLMTSHASLSSNYNMRVGRSEKPDGPYYDYRGFDLTFMASGGAKLAGNYQFTGYATGYAALGHNSVVIKDGKYMAVYHSRYKSGTGVSGNHNQFVSQLFFNQDGWPVMAPNKFAGESVGFVSVEAAAIDYDVLIHSSLNNEAFMTSVPYKFTIDGKILSEDGEEAGTWVLSENYYISIKLGMNSFEGVVVPQWNNDIKKAGLSITALDKKGLSLWANQRFE